MTEQTIVAFAYAALVGVLVISSIFEMYLYFRKRLDK